MDLFMLVVQQVVIYRKHSERVLLQALGHNEPAHKLLLLELTQVEPEPQFVK